jgi:hypothetical protein
MAPVANAFGYWRRRGCLPGASGNALFERSLLTASYSVAIEDREMESPTGEAAPRRR